MHKSVERELLELEALVNKKLKENAKLINISVHPSYEEKQFMPYIGCFTLKIKGKTANVFMTKNQVMAYIHAFSDGFNAALKIKKKALEKNSKTERKKP